MVITSPAFLQKLPLHKKPHALQLPKLRQPQTIILSCTFDLIFFFKPCRLSKTDPVQKPRRYSQLPPNTYPDTAPTLDHTAGWVGGTQMFPHSSKHSSTHHCYLLTCWKIPILAWHQALWLPSLAEIGHSSSLRISGKIWVHLFFFFFPFLSPPYNKNQQFCRSDLHFLISKKCTCQNTCEPQHVRGNSSLQFALEKHQALIIKLLIHREDAAPPLSEQLQKDQDLVLKEL